MWLNKVLRRSPNFSQGGFSLIEALVALALIGLVGIASVNVIVGAFRNFRAIKQLQNKSTIGNYYLQFVDCQKTRQTPNFESACRSGQNVIMKDQDGQVILPPDGRNFGDLKVTSSCDGDNIYLSTEMISGRSSPKEPLLSGIPIICRAPSASKICEPNRPVIDDRFSPIQKWHWTGWIAPKAVGNIPKDTEFSVTLSSPVAADLDGDGKTEIVVIASRKRPNYNYVSSNGTLVILEGTSGRPLFNSIEALGEQGEAMASTTPMLADLDKDGVAEIIFTAFVNPSESNHNNAPANKAVYDSGMRVAAIDYRTGQIKYSFTDPNLHCANYVDPTSRVETREIHFCMGSVADLDGDGNLEIIVGNAILNSNLSLKTFLDTKLNYAMVKTNSIAELVSTSLGLEVVANGAQVFDATGKKIWSRNNQPRFSPHCDGYSAVSDLDNNGSPELVCAGNANVSVFTSQGALIWQKPIPRDPDLPQLGGAGPPNVGNFIGDEKFEIGVAGADRYAVFDYQGNVLWSQPTQDRSSRSTGSTIFDFNGDGKAEVLYNDELYLRIYSGETGAVLWSTSNPTGTLWEYPVVVNVDDDSSSEIVVSSAGRGGVRVFEDPTKSWMYSRRVWNQYGYYPEIVDDSLKVSPISRTRARHGFRINTQGLKPKENNPCD